jgi:hypothetical protein
MCKAFKPVGWAKSSLARSDSTSKGGKTGENGGCEVAGSVAMRCAILCVIGRQFPEQNSFGSLNVATDRALSHATVDGHSHANGATLTTLAYAWGDT